MMYGTVYNFSYVSPAAVAAVKRRHPRNRAMVQRMPPVLVAFLYNVYSGGGYPIRSVGRRWIMDTNLNHIEVEIIEDDRAQLKVWARDSGPAFERPAVDRTIGVSKVKT